MSTFGNASTPGSGFFFDTRSNTQYSSVFNSFPGGYITQIHLYIAGDGGSVTIQYAIWGSGGTLFWNSAGHSIGGGTRNIGGQAWHSNGVSGSEGPGLYLGPSNLRFGLLATGGVVWTYEGSGSVDFDLSHTSPGTFSSNGTDGSGSFGAYVDYIAVPVPTISNVSPNVGTTGQTVTLTGTGFTYVRSATVNGTNAPTFSIISDTSMTVTIPSGTTPGTGTITVTNDAGTGSIAFNVGQVYFGSGGGGVGSILAVKYGPGAGAVANAVGIWVPTGGPPPTGVKRVW